MGCTGSRFDELPVVGCDVLLPLHPVLSTPPVSGHQSGLPVLPRCEMYLRPGLTVLKLREKFFSFSGDVKYHEETQNKLTEV